MGRAAAPTAAKTLQSHVKRLRRALEPGRARGAAGEVLVTRQPGYLLRVAPGALDATRFEELTAKARRALSDGRPTPQGRCCARRWGCGGARRSRSSWTATSRAAEADRLAELRLGAVEDRLEADLRLGRHRELVAELEGLVRDHPLRERLWAQLLLALYRSGRQADALLAYQRARSILVEELGIDPGAELRRLHAAVLAQDPGLDLPAAGRGGPGPGAARRRWRRWARCLSAGRPSWPGCGPPGHGPPMAGAGWSLWPARQGMGKTRLAAALAREVHDQGGWVLYGRCAAAASDPLQPFAQALTGVGASPRTCRCPVPASPRRPSARRSPTCWPVGPTGRCCWSWMTSTWPRRQCWRRWLVLRPRPPRGGCWCWAPTATRRPRQSLRRWSSGWTRAARRGGGWARWTGMRSPRSWACTGASRQRGRPPAVLERTGGVPLLVHQAASDWAHTAAERQVEQTARQTASSRSHLRVVQAKLADDVVDLQELREPRSSRSWRRPGCPEDHAGGGGLPLQGPGPLRGQMTPSSSSAGSGWSPSWSPTWSGPAWSGWSAPRAAASPRWSGRACCRPWPTACCPAATAGGSC